MAEPGAGERTVRRPAMGISHGDFFRVLPSLLADAQWRRDGLSIRADWPDGRRLRATVSAERERRIAALSLPVADVELGFSGGAEAWEEGFVGRFDRAFQKGGG